MSEAVKIAEDIVEGKEIITKESPPILLIADTLKLRNLGIALNILYKRGYTVKAGWRYGHEAVVVMERNFR